MTTPSIGFGPDKGPDLGAASVASRLAKGAVSTVGDVLPGFLGRLEGDLHTIPPESGTGVGEHYVAVGEDGRGFTDDYNRTNSTNLGNGWVETGGNFEIFGNKLRVNDNAASCLVNFGNMDQDVTATVSGVMSPGVLVYSNPTPGVLGGYFAQVFLTSTSGINCTLRRDNVEVATGRAGSPSAALGVSAKVTVACRLDVVSVLVNDVVVLQYTETAGRPTGTWCGPGNGTGALNEWEDFSVYEPGTYEWLQVGGGGGGTLADYPPPQVNYTASQTGGDEAAAARGDHTHKSLQFAYDYVIVT